MASIKSQKALTKGSECPPLEKGVLRLYSHRFCPFAQRTRLVLAYKNINYELVNVAVRDKPDWFVERNPLGMVPVLEQDEKVVYESAICNDYLDDVYPQRKLTPSDPYVKARHQILIEMFGKVVSNWFKHMMTDSEDEKLTAIQEAHKALQPFEDALKGKYFGGENPAMLDFHMWPFFERMEMTEGEGGPLVPSEKFPKLVEWVGSMLGLPEIKKNLFDFEMHKKFFVTYRAGKPEYDMGLGLGA